MEPNQPVNQPSLRRRYRPHEASDPAKSFDMQVSIKDTESQRVSQTNSSASNQNQAMHYPSQYSSLQPSESPANEKNSKNRSLPYYIGITLCTVVLVISGSMLFRYYSQIHRANTASGQLRQLYQQQENASPVVSPAASEISPSSTDGQTESPVIPTAAPSAQLPESTMDADSFLAQWPSKYPGNEQMRIQDRFTPLRQQNRDIVGWLTIDGVVDEPVFQRDNSYYLTHDATGAKNPTGALFLDENCNLRTVPMQTLIHGHNMKEGAMFGSLKKYKVKDAAFYKEHPFIRFDSLYESATYVIFSVAEVNTVAGNTHYFPFWHRFTFDDEQAFSQYVSLAKEYSRIKVNIDVKPGDRLLTLATCSSGDDNLRLMIMARMLRADEDTIQLSNQIYSATTR